MRSQIKLAEKIMDRDTCNYTICKWTTHLPWTHEHVSHVHVSHGFSLFFNLDHRLLSSRPPKKHNLVLVLLFLLIHNFNLNFLLTNLVFLFVQFVKIKLSFNLVKISAELSITYRMWRKSRESRHVEMDFKLKFPI